MNLLVLGGTRFIGRAIAEGALAQGWEVTTFNRGQSGPSLAGAEAVCGDRWNLQDLTRLAKHGRWDAVVDTSGYIPSNVLQVANALESVTSRYVFMSTVSVYEGWPIRPLTEASPTLYCPPDADETYGTDTEDGPTRYGYQKSGCETAVREVFGPHRSMILRPGIVLGPFEYVGRLPWWLNRIAGGGRILAPGEPDRPIQPIDVRDIAAFTLLSIIEQLSDVFNLTGPGTETFEDLLNACATATMTLPDLVWTPDNTLLECGVRQWSEMPLWRTASGTWGVDSMKARDAGLKTRPLSDTARDTWAWIQNSGAVSSNDRSSEIGISRYKEDKILSA